MRCVKLPRFRFVIAISEFQNFFNELRYKVDVSDHSFAYHFEISMFNLKLNINRYAC